MTDSKAGIVTNYDAATIYLHWLTAILIIALWLIAMTDDWFPRGPLRDTVKSLHVVLGFAAVFVTAARIVWRSSFGLRLPPASSGFLYLAGEAVHYLLLVLLVAALATGIVTASYRASSIFSLWHVPQFGTGDRAIRRSLKEWHELAAHTLLIVAAVHAMAALMHQFMWRDRLIDRMRR